MLTTHFFDGRVIDESNILSDIEAEERARFAACAGYNKILQSSNHCTLNRLSINYSRTQQIAKVFSQSEQSQRGRKGHGYFLQYIKKPPACWIQHIFYVLCRQSKDDCLTSRNLSKSARTVHCTVFSTFLPCVSYMCVRSAVTFTVLHELSSVHAASKVFRQGSECAIMQLLLFSRNKRHGTVRVNIMGLN
jgi:hypothetical protein